MFPFLTTRWHCIIFFFFNFPLGSNIFYSFLSCSELGTAWALGCIIKTRQKECFPLPSLWSEPHSFPPCTQSVWGRLAQQVLDAVPARAGSVWFALFFSPELKAMHTILFGDFFFSCGETDKMNDCPGSQLRSSREPSSRSSECHVGHVCDIQRKRFEDRSLGTLHMDIHTHPDARLSAACLPQYWRWDSPPPAPWTISSGWTHSSSSTHSWGGNFRALGEGNACQDNAGAIVSVCMESWYL